MLRLRELPELSQQGILPCGDAVHPPEADAPRRRTHPRQPLRDRRLIHRLLEAPVTVAGLFLSFSVIAAEEIPMVEGALLLIV
jgi:hypothetical protein